jgi:hypothetical protein
MSDRPAASTNAFLALFASDTARKRMATLAPLPASTEF